MPQSNTFIRNFCLISFVFVAGVFIGYSMPSITSHNTDSSEEKASQGNIRKRKESPSNLDKEQVDTNAFTLKAQQALSFDQKVTRIGRLQDDFTHDATIEKLSLLSTMSEAELQQLLADASKKAH